jgi:dethiobiotin synthetase
MPERAAGSAGPQAGRGAGAAGPQTVILAGTGTGVGKTWVATRLARLWIGWGVAVTPRKPAQSFDPADGPTDAALLAAACHVDPDAVCPAARSYPAAMAPPLAAEHLGLPPPRLADLVAAPAPTSGLVLVEGVGGPRSPLAVDGDTVALANALGAARVVVVAPSGLGAINDVLLSVEAFGDRPTTAFLNRFDAADPVHSSNRAWLERHLPTPPHTVLEALAADLLPVAGRP